MEENKTRSSPYSFIPDASYELIVYISSGILFVALIGLIFFSPEGIYIKFAGTGTFEKFIIVVGIIFITYVYGQMASVLSTYLVKKQVQKFVEKFMSSKSDDFNFNYPHINEKFELLRKFPNKLYNNQWSLLYFMKRLHPDIGDDLLERYARLKLARLNAFNLMLLLVAFCISTLFFSIGIESTLIEYDYLTLKFGTLIVLTLGFIIEYTQRQIWFGDILIKSSASIPSD